MSWQKIKNREKMFIYIAIRGKLAISMRVILKGEIIFKSRQFFLHNLEGTCHLPVPESVSNRRLLACNLSANNLK